MRLPDSKNQFLQMTQNRYDPKNLLTKQVLFHYKIFLSSIVLKVGNVCSNEDEIIHNIQQYSSETTKEDSSHNKHNQNSLTRRKRKFGGTKHLAIAIPARISHGKESSEKVFQSTTFASEVVVVVRNDGCSSLFCWRVKSDKQS